MADDRPPVPLKLQRAVFIEAGHICAVCARSRAREIHHIGGFDSEVGHRQRDLIALCPNCHDEVEYGRRIDNRMLRVYKARMTPFSGPAILRVIEHFTEGDPHPGPVRLSRIEGRDLVNRGVLVPAAAGAAGDDPTAGSSWPSRTGVEVLQDVKEQLAVPRLATELYELTDAGREWLEGVESLGDEARG